MSTTTNYNLNLPQKGQKDWNIQVNENFTKIDTEIYENENNINEINNSINGISNQLADNTNKIGILNKKTDGVVNLKEFGAVGDGIVDDTQVIIDAIAYAVANNKELHIPPGVYITTKEILIDQPIKIVSLGRRIGFYIGFSETGIAEIRKVNGDTDGDKVIHVKQGASGTTIEGLLITCASAENIKYYDAALNTTASNNNTSYGLYIEKCSDISIINCGVHQAKVVGFYDKSGSVNKFIDCTAAYNYLGHRHETTDGYIDSCHYRHNVTNGLEIYGNYTRVINCRFEWNAQNGVKSMSGENQFTGNLFDRNGYAGLALWNGWGHTVVGNYFSRNGAGGDGEFGRWGFSVPGHPSYIDVPNEERCHIRLVYQRDVTISGNRYRVGKDDASQGSDSPSYIYHAGNAIACSAVGNAGESITSGGYGGCITSVEVLTNNSQSSLFLTNTVLPTTVKQNASAIFNTNTISIPIGTNFSGKIIVNGGAFQNKQLFSELYIIRRSDNAYGMVNINDKGNVTVTSTSYSGNNITINLSDKVYVVYTIEQII